MRTDDKDDFNREGWIIKEGSLKPLQEKVASTAATQAEHKDGSHKAGSLLNGISMSSSSVLVRLFPRASPLDGVRRSSRVL